jgi:hypothetical protein
MAGHCRKAARPSIRPGLGDVPPVSASAQRSPCVSTPRRALAAAALGLLLAACGDTAATPQVVGQTPVTAATVTVRQTGLAAAVVDQSSVHFAIDGSGGLVISASVRSQAHHAVTLSIRASLYDGSGALIGDAAGGTLAVPHDGTAALRLTGPAPRGTITSATFEVSTAAAPTPT